MKKLIVYAIFLIVVWLVFFKKEPTVELGPGVRAANDPVQINSDSIPSFMFGDYQIIPQAEFDLQGKILAKKYYSDSGSDLAFVDLAMGWGNMSDESVLKDITITQSGRWYRWTVDAFPIPKREIETHSANMHIMAADEDIRDRIEETPAGSIIGFKGYLIRAEKPDGWHWQSSMTRKDTGGGACELVFVKDFYVIE